jgi:ATP/maltotriose-dependent transcriptional regulator MalT/DNA-binding SARP family transcriptional activator
VPAPATPHLRRVDAVAVARRGLEAGMLRVVAPAGYGKTGLIADTIRAERAVAWVSAAAGPPRSAPIAALARALGVPVAAAGGGRAGADARADALCRAMERRGAEGAILVVDDAHRLTSAGLTEVTALAARSAGTARLVVAGRHDLPESLSAARPDAVCVGPEVLALSADECAALMGMLGREPTIEEATQRAHETEGWVAGVVLGERPGADPLAYLLREAVDPLPPDAAAALTELAVVDRFTPALAATLTGREDAADLIGLARARGGFLVPSAREGPPWLRHHRQMRAALARRVADAPPAQVAALHRRAAGAWESLGRPEAAARHHLASGDLEGAIEALEPLARAEPRRAPVRDLLRTVPPRAWSDAPGRVLAMASYLFYRADYLRAFEAMERGAFELADAGDLRRASVVLVRLLRAAPLAGGLYERTVEAARELLPRVGSDPGPTAAALTMLGLILGEAGDHTGAEAELLRAEEILGDDPLIGARTSATRAFAVDFPQGRVNRALALLDDALPALEAHAERDDLNYLLYALAFRAIILADLGAYEEALSAVARFERAAEAEGLARLGRPVARILRLSPLAGLRRWDELGADVARGAPAGRRFGGALRSYRLAVARAQLAAAQGDHARLVAAVDDATRLLADHGLPHDAAMAFADLAAAALDADDRGRARDLAARAGEEAERVGAPRAAVRAAIAMARAEGPGEAGDRALDQALRRSADGSMDGLWASREREAAAELLPRALVDGLGPAGTAARLALIAGGEVEAACLATGRMIGATTAGAGVGDDSRAGADGRIHMVTLGHFAVQRDGLTIDEGEFGRRKARSVLAILLCMRRAVHREELVELLWPELPPRRGLAALHSTVHVLRRTLDPRPSADGTSVVHSDGIGYRVVLGPAVTWDADLFMAAARRAHAAGPEERTDALLRAESLYAGSLLPEWPFAAWTRALRAEIEETHRVVIEALAREFGRVGRHGEAIGRYRLLLALEPEREGWHRGLMEQYAAAGERALALRQYQACRAVLLDGLGVEPSRATRELHTRILREG